MEEYNTLYLCDPERATTCGKEGCHLNNGPCHMTTNREHAYVKNGEALVVMTATRQERVVKNGCDLLTQVDIALKLATAKRDNIHLDILPRSC